MSDNALTAICAPRIFDGLAFHENAAVMLRSGRIQAVVPAGTVPRDAKRETLDAGILAPGFVDLQVNGGGGRMFNADPSVETLRIMAGAHASWGATHILPTLITDSREVTAKAIDAVACANNGGVPGILGLHLEGPHLSLAKAGAHDPGLIRPPSEEDIDLYREAAARLPLLKITLAPEVGGEGIIPALAEAGVLVSLGHSAAEIETVRRAEAEGAACVTHLFNAQSGLDHRNPGVAAAAMTSPNLRCGVIADGHHVHPAMLRLAAMALGPREGLFLVSDAMATAASDIDAFELNGRVITKSGDRLTLADDTLAGAHLPLSRAVALMAEAFQDEAAALAAATRIPADVAGRKDLGRFTKGARADLVHLSDTFELKGVWRDGVPVGAG